MQFKFNSTECNVKFPNIKALKEFREKTKGSEEESLELTIDFLVSLGLQKEVAEALEVEHLKQIIDSLAGDAKKN